MNKKTIIVLAFLASIKSATAFLSPDTITLISASIGPTVWGLLAVVAVNIIMYLKKAKKNTKKIITVLSVIAILLILVPAAIKYQRLVELNIPPAGIPTPTVKTENETTLKSEFVRINNTLYVVKSTNKSIAKINLQEAIDNGSYRIYYIYPDDEITVLNATATNLYELTYTYSEELFQKFIRENNIRKEDNIVLYCHSGISSRDIALIFAAHGYNAKYSHLTDITDEKYIRTKFGENYAGDIVIEPLTPEKDEQYVYFLMRDTDINIGVKEFKPLEGRIALVRTHEDINTEVIEEYDKNLLKNLEDIDFQNTKVLCKDKIHCFATKYYLYYINQTGIDKIYVLYDKPWRALA